MKKLIILLLVLFSFAANAQTALTQKASKFTVTGTSINLVTFDNVLKEKYGIAWITVISGTAVNVSGDGTTVTTSSELLSASGNNTRTFVEIQRGIPLQILGGAGSEVLNIVITTR